MERSNVKFKTNISLNVYDLIPQNDYFYMFGFGAFHSGVVILGQEITFGYHAYDTSGVFATQPGEIPGCTLRQTIDLGEIETSHADLKEIIDKFGKSYTGKSYHLLRRNCNHFTDEFVCALRGEGIPQWVNRTSWWVSTMECCIPSKYLPKSPGAEIETECTCSSQQETWSTPGRSLMDNDVVYSPLPQQVEERRQMIERHTLERLRKG